jgi:hypothetical protein
MSITTGRFRSGAILDTQSGMMATEQLTIAAFWFFCSTAWATSPPVTFESPCDCRDNHGEHRWSVKNDPSLPPTDASAIQAVTPSDVFSWAGHTLNAKLRALALSFNDAMVQRFSALLFVSA